MKYRYSRFKSGILYCALQEKYLPAGAEIFRARSGPQGAGVAKTWGSLVAQFEGPFCEILTKKSQKKIRNLVHKSPLIILGPGKFLTVDHAPALHSILLQSIISVT
jgi:hypothetical protein